MWEEIFVTGVGGDVVKHNTWMIKWRI